MRDFVEFFGHYQKLPKYSSNSNDYHKSKAYLAIIQMGRRALPFIFSDLMLKGPAAWLWGKALEDITGRDMVVSDHFKPVGTERWVNEWYRLWIEWAERDAWAQRAVEHFQRWEPEELNIAVGGRFPLSFRLDTDRGETNELGISAGHEEEYGERTAKVIDVIRHFKPEIFYIWEVEEAWNKTIEYRVTAEEGGDPGPMLDWPFRRFPDYESARLFVKAATRR